MFTVDKAHQRVMEEAFYRQLAQRCRPNPDPSRPLPRIVGVETEYILIDQQNQLVSEATRNQVLASLDHSSPELGISTLETHTDPVPLMGGDHDLLAELQRVEDETIAAAQREGCRLVRTGSYPGPFSDLAVTQYPDRYQRLMDVSHELHGIDAPPITVGELTLPRERCTVMSGCQSVHINIQLPAGEFAVRLLNKAIELVPYLVALSANSPLMDSRPTGYTEYRIPLWEPLFSFPSIDAEFGVNTRRVSFPDYYYRNWDDYWRDVARKLYMTHDSEEALDSNIKQFWRTVRIKPCPGRLHDCLLEIRALSTQPTLLEDVALYLLIGGLLHEPSWFARPLLPMEYVKVNFDQASRYGLAAYLYERDGSGTIVQRPAAAIAGGLLDAATHIWQEQAPHAADIVALLRRRLTPVAQSPAEVKLSLYNHARAAGATPGAAAQQVFLTGVIQPERSGQ